MTKQVQSIKTVNSMHFTDPLFVGKNAYSSGSKTEVYTLPDMPYDYSALEPVISGDIMNIHHKKHHQAYVTNLNVALEKYAAAEAKRDVGEMIAQQQAIRFNGGGHVNHSIFWTNLAPPKKGGGGKPDGELAKKLDDSFGSFDKFITKFNTQTGAIQGSGWGWLGYNKAEDKLVVTTCANQDPLTTQGLIPLLGIDVWEHVKNKKIKKQEKKKNVNFLNYNYFKKKLYKIFDFNWWLFPRILSS